MLVKKNNQRPDTPEIELFGLKFHGRIALEEGYDVFCDKFNELNPRSAFIEIGPVTPEKQNISVNKKGFFKRTVYGPFASKGVKYAIDHLTASHHKRLIAANISYSIEHNAVEDITKDVTTCYTYLYDFVDMFVLDTFRASYTVGNALQDVDILSEVVEEILQLRRYYEVNKPILLRINSSICDESLNEIIDFARISGIDGLILKCNSFRPEFIKQVSGITQGRLPFFVSGDIDSVEKANSAIDLGASMVMVKNEYFDKI